MWREEAIREVLRQNPPLYYRYCILSAVLFVMILFLLFTYVFLF
jgi:hypothetical protein